MPEHSDQERVADLILEDEQLIEAMLSDERLFQRLMGEADVPGVDPDRPRSAASARASDEVLLFVSPWLFFTVLLQRARRDLERETFTTERRHQQKVLLFDTDQVIELLEQESLRDYLAAMLASFTRIQSRTMAVRVRQGLWHKYRISDLNVESMVRYCQALDEDLRFEPYKRIADVCLFMAGMFPDYIEAQHRYPLSRRIRPRMKGRICKSREDYEAHGRAFYRLAAEHERAGVEGLDGILATLSERFILAEKPLSFVADRYLHFTRHRLFEL